MLRSLSLRSRLVLAFFVAVILPSGLLLAGGFVAFREVVVVTGSAGPWGQVAESGILLLDELEREEPRPDAVERLAERHRRELSESVRFSRIYALLGERVLFLLPLAALVLLLLAVALAFWFANTFSRRISHPVESLVGWTERVGRDEPLPAPTPEEEAGAPEFRELRQALRRMEGELLEARKKAVERARMRSWTEMARRLAHDLKNPLTPMTMAARTAAGAKDPAAAAAGSVLLEEIQRLDEMARSLADFARTPEGPTSKVDLGELLEGLARRLGQDTTPLEVHLPPEPVMVEGHPLVLERVVRNLVVNAQEALIEGGIQPSGNAGAPDPVEIQLTRDADHAVIRVLDRGPGIPPGNRDRIWDPEFTTRRKGTGLGLPLVRQAVNAHGGQVTALDREGGGTEFRIHLPLATSPSTSAPEAP
jgi:two-component system, NtrC family, nitrogen regulation sensor histidine kinase NtrY